MLQIDDREFEKLISEGIDKIPELYQKHLQNVAFIVEDEPTIQQRIQLNLYPSETLFGLYEGVPLPGRGGTTKLLPDKITLFKNPMLRACRDLSELREQVRHTIWH